MKTPRPRFVYGPEHRLHTAPTSGATDAPYRFARGEDALFTFDGCRFGQVVFRIGRSGEVEEYNENPIHAMGKDRERSRVVARVLPEDVIDTVEEIDGDVAELELRIRALKAKRQDVLRAALPRCAKVRQEEVLTREQRLAIRIAGEG